MSISKALNFVKSFAMDDSFRKECHQYSKEELAKKYGFSDFELEDAINMNLVKCQTEEEAMVFLQLRMYYQIL